MKRYTTDRISKARKRPQYRMRKCLVFQEKRKQLRQFKLKQRLKPIRMIILLGDLHWFFTCRKRIDRRIFKRHYSHAGYLRRAGFEKEEKQRRARIKAFDIEYVLDFLEHLSSIHK